MIRVSSSTREYLRFALKILLFVAFFLFVDNVLFAQWISPILEHYRPSTVDIGPEKGIVPQRQMIHIRQLSRKKELNNRVIFVGTSSVANGIDTNIIADSFKARGIPLEPLNYGMTILLAYELLFFQPELLNERNKYVIYLYNPNSFSDNLSPSVTEYRWKTWEMLHIAGPNLFSHTPLSIVARGVVSELSFSIRNAELLQYLSMLWIKGALKPAKHDFDYPVDEPIPTIRERKYAIPEKATELVRGHYLTSDTDASTLGYRGLDRFLKLASRTKVRIIVMPIPEPAFADFDVYRQGVNVPRIDRRVKEICEQHGVEYIPRTEVSEFEQDDTLFRDPIHFHTLGRNKFSAWLADRVAKIENR